MTPSFYCRAYRSLMKVVRIGVTLGDPAGVGPEVVAKSVALFPDDKIYLIGNKDNFLKILQILKMKNEIQGNWESIDVPGAPVEFGIKQKSAGEIALRSIEAGIRLAQDKEIDVLVTAPVNKETLIMAGSMYVDHETMLSSITHSEKVCTVFEVDSLRVMFMPPKHVPLKDAIAHVTEENVFTSISLAEMSLQLLGLRGRRKIAVAALNPHAGDGGLLGKEELEWIEPAIKKASSQGVEVSGPYPADSVFHRASTGEFDIVVSLYHDQGHIATKMIDFYKTVSLTLGLPFLRTSVDHGTGFDIAGKNIANPASMIEAIRLAKKYGVGYESNYLAISKGF
jgi:4-phospho-D-threonate 3-dehydrogenase / 4-phospho-D-erythronate 3-dehydrogenase